jgi:DegV family protein with EDD domain
VPLSILSEGKAYRDGIDLTPTQAYELFLKNPDTFSTSTPSPATFLSSYREAAKESKSILCVTLSSHISATYEAALMAKDLAAKEIPDVKIEVVDSRTATIAEGFVAMAAARAAASGSTFDEVISTANLVRDKVDTYVLLDTVKHVYRSGRVPKVAAQAGSFFNIRAIFRVKDKVQFTGIVRNRERGIEMMLEKIKGQVRDQPIHAAVMHAYASESAVQLQERIAKELNCKELLLTEFSPLMGYACGTGTLGIAYYPD